MPTVALSAPPAKANFNPLTGVFGTGQIRLIFKDENFIAPITGKYRIRVWGAGGRYENYTAGAGGGFAIKEVDLEQGEVVPVTVALSEFGNTTSFGAFVSATSGESGSINGQYSVGGVGVGGDLNYRGGTGENDSSNESDRKAGGAASLFGDGGDGYGYYIDKGGSAGGTNQQIQTGGHDYGFQECMRFGLDFIGAGRSANMLESKSAASGGAPSSYKGETSTSVSNFLATPGFPAAGACSRSSYGFGANGLATVEY